MLTAKQTAERLQYSISHLRNMRLAGRIKGKRIGRDYFYTEAEVERVAALPRPKPGWPKGRKQTKPRQSRAKVNPVSD